MRCAGPVEHDHALLDMAKSLKPDLIQGLEGVTIGHRPYHDRCLDVADKHENYVIDPLALDSILDLPPFSLLREKFASTSRLATIATVDVPLSHQESQDANSIGSISSIGPCNSRCDIDLVQNNSSAFLQRLKYESSDVLKPKPTADCFFQTGASI